MENETEIKLREIGPDFGEGKFISWKDGDIKKVLITNWGVYDKPDDVGRIQTSFRCDVLNVDGKEYIQGMKVIDTTSSNFHKAIKPFLEIANKKPIALRIQRLGEKKKTTFLIQSIDMGPKK